MTDDRKKALLTEGKLTEKGAESLGRAALVYNTEPIQVVSVACLSVELLNLRAFHQILEE